MNETTAIPSTLIPSIIREAEKIDLDLGDGGHGYHLFCATVDGWYVEIHYETDCIIRDIPGDYWTPGDREIYNSICVVTDIDGFLIDEETGGEAVFGIEDVPELKEEFEGVILSKMDR